MDPVPVFNADPDKRSFWDKFKDEAVELIEFSAIVIAIVMVIHFMVAEPHKVSGSSMVPNFIDGDYIITDKLSKYFGPYQRGEVIILKNPRNTSEDYIKRIIGLPGEKIKVDDGKVFINGQALSEPYLPTGLTTSPGDFLHNGQEITIPANYYIVFGDNRPASSDSREWGLLQKDLIIGRALLRYWPPQKFKLINIDEPSAQGN